MTKKVRKQCTARKLDRQKVLELHQRGFTNPEIAKQQGVAPSTVWRFLQQTQPEKQALEQFKKDRGDVFARLQAKSLDIQAKILDSLNDGVIDALLPHQKNGLLGTLSIQSGVLYDRNGSSVVSQRRISHGTPSLCRR